MPRLVSPTVKQVADAVAATINTGTYSTAFTAESAYIPNFSRTGLTGLRVDVVTVERTIDAHDRYGLALEYSVNIGVSGPTSKIDNEPDPYVQVVEEIIAHLWDMDNRIVTAGVDNSTLSISEMENDPIYDFESLNTTSEFISVLNAKYRVVM